MSERFIRDHDNRIVDCGWCGDNYAIAEYCGYCEVCWVQLSPAERAILKGIEPPVEKQVIVERVIRVPRPATWIWRLLITVAVCLLLWKEYHETITTQLH